ncbi:MAG: cell division protein ZapA [Deltaproteobacteria bacterium]|nr:cell division protein ZapA [Deltaproteobacteria bacterium]
MGNSVEVKLLEQRLLVKTDEDEEYTKRVVDLVDNKIHEIRDNARIASKLDVALLTAMNIAGEYIKTRERLEKLELKADKLSELIDAKITKTV